MAIWQIVMQLEDIRNNVLSRLPVKSVIRFKCVCKSWRRFMSGSMFVRMHLSQSQKNPTYVSYSYILEQNNQNQVVQREEVSKTDGETAERFPGNQPPWSYFKGAICSFNGLVCCYGSLQPSTTIVISNPATLQSMTLPPLPVGRVFEGERYPEPGVLFSPAPGGSNNNGYKVFRFFCRGRNQAQYESAVYSSNDGSWRVIAGAEIPKFTSINNHVCVNGTVFWLCNSITTRQFYVLAVTDEGNFGVIRIPEENSYDYREAWMKMPFLVDFKGGLGLVVLNLNLVDGRRPNGYIFDVWKLQKNYSDWVKTLSDYIPPCQIDHVLTLKDDIVFGNFFRSAFYNVKSRSWRNFRWQRHNPNVSGHHDQLVRYSESLVDCNGILFIDD